MDQILKMGKQFIKSKSSSATGHTGHTSNATTGHNGHTNQYQQPNQYTDDYGGHHQYNYDRPLVSPSSPPSYYYVQNPYPYNYASNPYPNYPNTNYASKPPTTSAIKTFTDSKGRITENDFVTMAKQMGLGHDEAEVRNMFRNLDKNHNGRLDFTESLRAISMLKKIKKGHIHGSQYDYYY